jgi:hypothetical protein
MAQRCKGSAGALAISVLLRSIFCSCWQATQMKGWRSGVGRMCVQAARLLALLPGLGAAEPAAGQALMAQLERCLAAARGLELS